MIFIYRYTINDEEVELEKEFDSLGEAIEKFWRNPKIVEEKAQGNYITLLGIGEKENEN